MKVLIVAPTHPDLVNVPAEAAAAANALGATLLQGDVGVQAFMAALRDRYDLIWFATHGADDGVLLSDGWLKTRTLVQLLRTKAGAIFLNTCESEDIGLRLYAELRRPVICTIRPGGVEDGTAYITGAVFAGHLADGYSIGEAFELSRPGFDQDYRIFGSDNGGDRIDELHALIAEIGSELSGEIRTVEDRINKRISANHRPIPASDGLRQYWWAMVLLLATALVLKYLENSLMVLQIRTAIGVNPIVAMNIGAFSGWSAQVLVGLSIYLIWGFSRS